MRITNAMMIGSFLSDANASLNRLSKYQSQVDSTKKNARISDDPQATITALKARNRLGNLEMYQGNISTANSYLSEAESAADGLNQILQSVYEQVISAQSGAKSEEQLKVMAEEVASLRDEVLAIGNASIGTSYIFGGYNLTGSRDGASKTAPFSVDAVTGDLIYNGINLSQLAWEETYDEKAGLMSDCGSSILDLASELGGALTDANSLSAAEKARNAASGLISGAQAAMHAAEKFGIDPGCAEYQGVSDFLRDFSDLHSRLEQECSKRLAGDYVLESDPDIRRTADGGIDSEYYRENGISVMTEDEFDNCYSQERARLIVNGMAELLETQYDAMGDPIGSEMSRAIQALGEKVTVPDSVKARLDAESKKQTKLWIGASQTTALSFTGPDILGTGKGNLYHVLDQCAAMLSGAPDPGGLGGMITAIQKKQSELLNFQTKIGAMQTRMNLIGSRYDKSKINYTAIKSQAEDVDMADAITKLKNAQTVYSAALAAGAEIIQTSLLDFLK
ncbi:MAG TPA: hypothetical protein DD735_11010 [Clostridiales bacterium]|nr:hypothetical protein [Clostridiales bacterium]